MLAQYCFPGSTGNHHKSTLIETTLVVRGTVGGGSTAKQTCTFKSDFDYQLVTPSWYRGG